MRDEKIERPRAPADRVPGIDKGKLKIAKDLDRMSESKLDEWYVRPVFPS